MLILMAMTDIRSRFLVGYQSNPLRHKLFLSPMTVPKAIELWKIWTYEQHMYGSKSVTSFSSRAIGYEQDPIISRKD